MLESRLRLVYSSYPHIVFRDSDATFCSESPRSSYHFLSVGHSCLVCSHYRLRILPEWNVCYRRWRADSDYTCESLLWDSRGRQIGEHDCYGGESRDLAVDDLPGKD